MNANKPHTEYTNWQELYLPAESRWQDLKRLSEFILPIIVLVFFATIYAIGVTAIHFEDWFTASNNQFSYYMFLARIFIVVFLPVIAAIAGLRFIFKQTREFILTIYQPAEDENLTPLVLRRLLGIPPFPPPLNTLLKYPFIVIKERAGPFNSRYSFSKVSSQIINQAIHGILEYLFECSLGRT